MQIKFKASGHSPEIGNFVEGETRDIPDHVARTYIERGQAEALKQEKGPPVKAADKEVA